MMGDIQAMFYQVRVQVADHDLLRYFLVEALARDLKQDLEESRMTVHFFGAVSSPGCANFAIRKNTGDLKHEFPSDVLNIVLTNFYVDDCLKSLPSSGAALSTWMPNENLC